jgi:integrase
MHKPYRRKDSRYWWITYTENGVQHHESTKSESEEYAKRLLKIREGEIAQGKQPAILYDRLKFDEMMESLKADYRMNNRRSLDRLELSINALEEVFGRMKVARITTDTIDFFIEKRMRKGRKNATINRDLAALRRAFRLAQQSTPPKVAMIPYIRTLKENNVRTGYFGRDEFLKLRAALPSYLRPVATFAYRYGWRKREITKLTWDEVDLNLGIIRLDPAKSKNGEAREVVLDGECLRDIAILFATRNGEQIKDFRDVWRSTREKVGLNGKLFHDFRRTAVGNMVRSGTPEKVAMQITGHKTRSVFDRYNIVNQEDVRRANERLDKYYENITFPPDREKTEKPVSATA